MDHESLKKLIEIIDKMSEDATELSIEDVAKAGEKEGLENVDALIQEAIKQGLVFDLGDGRIQKIVKRMFW